jgi:hypothetical protein
MALTILERGLPIWGLRPNHVCEVSRRLFQLQISVIQDMVNFLQDWIVNPMLNLLKRTMTYPKFEPGTFGLTVSIANHYII